MSQAAPTQKAARPTHARGIEEDANGSPEVRLDVDGLYGRGLLHPPQTNGCYGRRRSRGDHCEGLVPIIDRQHPLAHEHGRLNEASEPTHVEVIGEVPDDVVRAVDVDRPGVSAVAPRRLDSDPLRDAALRQFAVGLRREDAHALGFVGR